MNKQRTVILSINSLTITRWLDEDITTVDVAEGLGISLRHFQSALAGGVISFQLALKIANFVGEDVNNIIKYDSARSVKYAGNFTELIDLKSKSLSQSGALKEFNFLADKIHEHKVIDELASVIKNSHVDLLENPLPDKELLEKFQSITSALETTSFTDLRPGVSKPRTLSESLEIKEGLRDLQSLISEMYRHCYAFYFCRLPIWLERKWEDYDGKWIELDEDESSYQDFIFIAKDDLNFVYLKAATVDPSDWAPRGTFEHFEKIEKPYLQTGYPKSYYQFKDGVPF